MKTIFCSYRFVCFTSIIALLFMNFACNSPQTTNTDAQHNDTTTFVPERTSDDAKYIAEHYIKREYRVPMRDGVTLFTAVYSPRDTATTYPILYKRTPYSLNPYGEGNMDDGIGTSMAMVREKFIFVLQDVRGKFMSEGEFVDVRPLKTTKKDKKDTDESTDAYDTIEWLLANINNHNGKVGMFGNSYPGFYAAAAAVNAHPALKCVIPQCPVSDWFWDDFRHNGTFFTPHFFWFFGFFGQERTQLTQSWPEGLFSEPSMSGYDFFLNEIGPLHNINDKFYKNRIAYWSEISQHPNYDQYWQERSIVPHLKNIAPAVLTVGGWYDAEDLYGPLAIYNAIEKNSKNKNMLVMGPWRHGGYMRTDGISLGDAYFGDASTSLFYLDNIELPFLRQHLKDAPDAQLPEAYLFETGNNKWRRFDTYPPANMQTRQLYLLPQRGLSFDKPTQKGTFDEFVSDPDNPVPYSADSSLKMVPEYMTEDQRFVANRKDVLVYQTDVLTDDVTLIGKMLVNLVVATSQTDADWVVKLIDVLPDNHPPFPHQPDQPMGGAQLMVRSEVFRGRFRNSFEKPEPFVANQPTVVPFTLLDVLHTFKKGHRIMIQVQSSWFPLCDRNPQKYVDNIFAAKDQEFVKATHRVYTGVDNSSYITVGVLPK